MALTNPTMVSGTRARVNLSTNREDTQFESGIGLFEPEKAPMTSITMSLGKQTSKTIDIHWFEDEITPVIDTVDYGAGYDASSTAIDVDNGGRFAVGYLVMHNKTREVMLVTGVTADILTVVRDYGSAEGWTAQAGAITDGDYLTVVGDAYEQGHPLPEIISTQEIEYKNYCQDHRTPWGSSEVNLASMLRGESEMSLQSRKNIITHKNGIEAQNLWGMPYVGDKGLYNSSTGNTLPTTAGGINYFINTFGLANQKKDETELTEQEFINFLEFVFEFGSKKRICYCSPRLRTALDTWGISRQQTFTDTTILGMAAVKWVSSFGEIIFVTHDKLKNPETDDWLYNFFIDQGILKWNVLRQIGSTRLRKLDPYRATGATVKKQEMQTIGCIRWGSPWAHSRLRFKTIG